MNVGSIEWITVQPQSPQPAPPVVLVHGAWHGAWCWTEQAIPDLVARGLTVHAISLRGHGRSVPAGPLTTICDYVRDVQTVVRKLPQPPLVVGHSSGGYVVQLLMSGRCVTVPPLAGAVLLCSSPVSSPTYFLRRLRERAPMVDIRALLRREAEAVRTALFRADIAPADLERYRRQLVREPPLVTLTSMVIRPRPLRVQVPVLVIAAGSDAIFDVPAQQELAAAYRAELIVIPEAAHDLMLDPAWPLAGTAIAHFAATLHRSAPSTTR
ncbi:MAG: alpha/beta hydrolase [Chloroflexus sp.]|uniref:alpha/beta hydrolase n=1 Tax=Chloroflexus sp. TaxID=1904827 RepID=UPI00404B6558